jgi:hypothetical protein
MVCYSGISTFIICFKGHQILAVDSSGDCQLFTVSDAKAMEEPAPKRARLDSISTVTAECSSLIKPFDFPHEGGWAGGVFDKNTLNRV